MRKTLFSCYTLLSLSFASAGQDLSFFAPAQTSGTVLMKIYAVGNVTTGQPHLVTGTIPFTRGSVPASDLSRIRVIKNGVEQAAHISLLTPWRSITNPAVNGQTARVVQVQFNNVFTQLYPAYDSVIIEWGTTIRQLNLPLTNPSDAWHLVTSGSFVAADSVYEPDVITTLPKAWLCNGALKTRMDPFENNVSDTVENATAIRAISNWPNYTDMDHGQHNFFFTLINEGTPISATYDIEYKTDFEPWLYDRAASMYMAYLRSGKIKHLREAIRNANFYKRNLHPNGIFKLKQPTPNFCTGGNDAMYSMNECLAYSYWFTGDTSLPRWINRVADIHETCGGPYQWTPALGFWTERHNSFRLLANTIAWEVAGTAAYSTRITNMVNAFIAHQNGAGGQINFPRIDGALYHTKGQHGEGAVESDYIASNWMSALMTDAMLRAYGQSELVAIESFLIRMGNFQRRSSKNHTTDLLYDNVDHLWSIDYLVNPDGTSNEFNGDEYNHSMEVAASIAWGAWFAKKNGQLYDSLARMADSLYRTYSIGLDEYTRPGNVSANAPLFRIVPPRMYGWQYRPSASFSWLMRNVKTNIVLPVFNIFFNAYTVTNGNELSWTIEEPQELRSLQVERSADCSGFQPLLLISDFTVSPVYRYLDDQALQGKNCYRLKITTHSGEIFYSRVIRLAGDKKQGFDIYPNPVKDHLSFALRNDAASGAYQLRIYDMQGRIIRQEELSLRPLSTYTVSVSMVNGTYTAVLENLQDRVTRRQQFIVIRE